MQRNIVIDKRRKKIIQLYSSIQLLNYHAMDKVNEEILGRLVHHVHPHEDDSVDYYVDQIVTAFSERKVSEKFVELLLEKEMYEDLHIYNLLIE